MWLMEPRKLCNEPNPHSHYKMSEAKKKMTAEEQAASLDFLRSHGVEVETPEDRVHAAAAAQKLAGLKIGAPGTVSFT